MRRNIVAVFIAVLLMLCACVSSCASEKIVLGRDSIRVGVVFTSENFDIPDELADLVTNIFGNALAQTKTIKIIRFNQINSARQQLGFSKTNFSNTQSISAIGRQADVHFVVVTKIIYDIEKAAKKGAAKGIGKLFDVDVSPLVKQEKPQFEVSVIDCASAKIVFDNLLKIDLFSSSMKEELLAGFLSGGSLGLDSIDLSPLRDLAKKLAPLMERAVTEYALIRIQKETGNYEGMVNSVVGIMSGEKHDKDDIKAAVIQAMGNEVDSEKLDNVIDKAAEIVGRDKITDSNREEIKAAVMKALNDEILDTPASVRQDTLTPTYVPADIAPVTYKTDTYTEDPVIIAQAAGIQTNSDGKIIVGVLPFQSSTGDIDHSKAALIGDIFTQMLALSDKITIIGRERLTQIANDNRLSFAGYISQETALQIGKLANCNIIISGTVNEFSSKSKSGGMIVVSSAKEVAQAAADIQIMNADSNALILSLSESVRAAQSDKSINLLGIAGGKAQVDGMEGEAVAELASILSIKARGVVTGEFPTVTDVSRKEIRFNIGTMLGARKNGFYRVYTVEHGYEENIAVVKIKRADSHSSTANIAGKKTGKLSLIRPGDRVAPVTARDVKEIVKAKFIKSRS